MADFCMQCCVEELEVPAESNDLKGLCGEGFTIDVLCEGCGYTTVDKDGRCLKHDRHEDRRTNEHE